MPSANSGSGGPSMARTPSAAHWALDWRTAASARPSSKPAGSRTSTPQGWPACQPERARKFAVEAVTSAMLPQMSRRPSPSASTA